MSRIQLTKKTRIALYFLRIYVLVLVVLIFVKFIRTF